MWIYSTTFLKQKIYDPYRTLKYKYNAKAVTKWHVWHTRRNRCSYIIKDKVIPLLNTPLCLQGIRGSRCMMVVLKVMSIMKLWTKARQYCAMYDDYFHVLPYSSIYFTSLAPVTQLYYSVKKWLVRTWRISKVQQENLPLKEKISTLDIHDDFIHRNLTIYT
jgi:hypothetical protein